MTSLQSLIAIGPLPPSIARDASSLLALIDDLESEVLWASGVYEVADPSAADD